MVFHWRLRDKSPQVSRTLLSILAVFNNAIVWMVSTRPPTSKSSRPFNKPLVTVPKAPITIGLIVTFMFHSFFSSLARARYLSLFPRSFSFILWSAGTATSKILQVIFFLLIIIRSGQRQSSINGRLYIFLLTMTRSGRLADIWWLLYPKRIFYTSFNWWFKLSDSKFP